MWPIGNVAQLPVDVVTDAASGTPTDPAAAAADEPALE
jgi:hypothetical protein